VRNTEDKRRRKKKKTLADIEAKEKALLDQLPTSEIKMKSPLVKEEGVAPLVYAPRFPWPKREQWLVMFVQKPKGNKKALVGTGFVLKHEVISTFESAYSFDIKFRAPTHGIWAYELIVMNDSYRGLDQIIPFNVKVEKPRVETADKPKRSKKNAKGEVPDGEEDLDMSSDDEEEEKPDESYSWGEMVLNAIILVVLAVFVHNWLTTKGYWQRWFEPVIDRIAVHTGPPFWKFYEYIAPVWEPTWGVISAVGQWLADKLIKDIPEDARRPSQRAGAGTHSY